MYTVYTAIADKPIKSKKRLPSMRFSVDQIRELDSIAGTNGYLLMSLYVGIAKRTAPNMEDSRLAELLDVSKDTVKSVRLKLTEAGWFYRMQGKHKEGDLIVYLAGKQSVAENA